MDAIQAARLLRPGTSWNLRGDVLEQSIDGTPRVSIPTPDEIKATIAAAPPDAPSIATQVAAIWDTLSASSIPLSPDAAAIAAVISPDKSI